MNTNFNNTLNTEENMDNLIIYSYMNFVDTTNTSIHSMIEIINNQQRSFNQILNDISNEYDVKIYNFTNNYSQLKIWNNLDHIAYNENSNMFSEDVSKMILMELRK